MIREIAKDQFSCNRCGTCCRWPGYVRLKEGEAEKIADFLGLPLDEFVDKYTEITADRKNLSIIEAEEHACFFLTDSGCAINEVKPIQCQNFPYKWNFFGWRNKCEMGKNY